MVSLSDGVIIPMVSSSDGVILSEAKNLVVPGEEGEKQILRFAQNDRWGMNDR